MKNLRLIKERVLPIFCSDDYPRLVDFVSYYLEWLSEPDNPYHNIINLPNYIDIDNSVDQYMEMLKHTYAAKFPIQYAGDTKLLLKNIINIYNSKGTEESFRLFFRMLYNTFVEFYYPKQNILRVSDGRWEQYDYLYTHYLTIEELNTLIGCSLRGQQSGATAYVSNISLQIVDGGESRPVIVLQNLYGRFEDNEIVFVTSGPTDTKITQFQVDYASKISGYWSSTDGLLSSDKLIQDSYYYQDFSYELRTDVPKQYFEKLVKILLHPAGLKMFNSYLLFSGEDGNLSFPTKLSLIFYIWILSRSFYFEENIELAFHILEIYRTIFPQEIRKDLESYLLYDDIFVNFFEDNIINDVESFFNKSNYLIFDRKSGLFLNDFHDYFYNRISEDYDESLIYLFKLDSISGISEKTIKNGIIEFLNDEVLLENQFMIFSDNKWVQRNRYNLNISERKIIFLDKTLNSDAKIFWFRKRFIEKYFYYENNKKEYSFSELGIKKLEKNSYMIFCDGLMVNDHFSVKENRIICNDDSLLGKYFEICISNNFNLPLQKAYYQNGYTGFWQKNKVFSVPNSKIMKFNKITSNNNTPLSENFIKFDSISGLLVNEEEYPLFYTIDNFFDNKEEIDVTNGSITTTNNYNDKNIFIFINGKKVDNYLIKENSIILENKISGNGIIYALNSNVFNKKIILQNEKLEISKDDLGVEEIVPEKILIFGKGMFINPYFDITKEKIIVNNSDFYGTNIEIYIINK